MLDGSSHTRSPAHRRGILVRTLGIMALITWFILLILTYSSAWTRICDDWKELLFYGGIAIIAGISIFKYRVSRSSLNIMGVLFALYLITLIVSLAAPSPAPYEGILIIARISLWAALVLSFSFLSRESIQLLAKISVISTSIIAFIAWAKSRDYLHWPFPASTPGFVFPLGHISYFSDFLAIHLPLCALFIFQSTRWSAKFFWGIAFTTILMGVWIAATRATFVGMGAATIFAIIACRFLRTQPSWKEILSSITIVCVLTLACVLIQGQTLRGKSVVSRLGEISQNEQNIKGYSGARWHIYRQTFVMFLDRPTFGHGAGSFRFNYPNYAYRGDNEERDLTAQSWLMHPHNEILNQLAEVGIFGTLFAIAGVLLIFFKGIEYLRSTDDQRSAATVIATLAGITIALTSWQFSTTFLNPLIRLIVALLLGLLLREIGGTFKPLITIPRIKGVHIVAFIAIGAAGLILTCYGLSIYALERSYRVSTPADRLHWATIADQLAPGAFDPLFVFATTVTKFGDPAKAKRISEKLLHTYPHVPVVLYHTARMRLKEGLIIEAKSLLEQAITGDPNYVQAMDLLQKIKVLPSLNIVPSENGR